MAGTKVEVKMNTDFAEFALFGEGEYSDAKSFETLEIVRTFADELCDRLGVYTLKKHTQGTYFIEKLLQLSFII